MNNVSYITFDGKIFVTLKEEDMQGVFGKGVPRRIFESIRAEAQQKGENYIRISFIHCIFYQVLIIIIIIIIIETKMRMMTGRLYSTQNTIN